MCCIVFVFLCLFVVRVYVVKLFDIDYVEDLDFEDVVGEFMWRCRKVDVKWC